MLNSIRKSLFWLHLIVGCLGGLIILLMSLTGVLLTYERQIIARADRSSFQIATPGITSLPIEDLLSLTPLKTTTTVTLRTNPQEPIELNAGREGIIYLDPYRAQVLGSPDKTTREFFQSLRSWHRWLAWQGEWKATGRAITGACTLAFLLLVLSGLYLWMPRVWTWQHLRPITWFRPNLTPKARDFNWHNTIGLWSAIPLFFIILSALPISYQWANDMIYQVTGTAMPKQDAPPPSKGEPNRSGLNRMLTQALREPGWQSISFRVPADSGPIAFTIDRGDGGQPQLKTILTLDRASGVILNQQHFENYSTGRRIRLFSRFLHTGESLGILGQTIAGLASAGAVVLVWTGITLSLRRLSAWRQRTNKIVEQDQKMSADKVTVP